MANSAVVGILRALLTANTAEFDTAMKRAADSAKVFSKETKIIGQQATLVGAALTKTLTLPIVAVGGAVAKLAMDFESSFAGVRKTVKGSEAELAAMAQQFRDLSKQIPINVNELNRLGEAAGALGIPKGQIVDFARVMALLGVTTNVTADQAAESIAQIQNSFNAAGTDTDRFGSTLVALGNDGASTESQILDMAKRIAGAGNAIGITQGQVLAFASALSSVGIEAEMGGSAISRVFIDIASAVSKGGDAVKGFAQVAGQPIAEFSRLFKEDAATAITQFISGLGHIKDSGGDLLGTLEALGFTEIRVRDTLLRSAQAGTLLTDALKLQARAWEENHALTDEANERFKTTASQMTLLWNRVKDVGIALGNALLPAIQSTISFLNQLLPVAAAVADWFSKVPGPIQATAIGLLALTAAAGPAIYLMGQLILSASAVSGAFAANGFAARAASTSVTGFSAHLPTLTAALGGLGAKFALSSTAAEALGLTLSGVGYAAAIASAAFVGWKLGRWIGEVTGATDAVEYLASKMLGLSDAQIQASRSARDYQAALTDLKRPLNALAAADMAKFTNALEETKKKALALKNDLPAAVQAVEMLEHAVLKMGREGTLTPSVLAEVGRQARALEAAGAKLPEGLNNIVKALGMMAENAKPAAKGTSDVGREIKAVSKEATKAAEELQKMQDHFSGAETLASLEKVKASWAGVRPELKENRLALARLMDEYEPLRKELDPSQLPADLELARAKFHALPPELRSVEQGVRSLAVAVGDMKTGDMAGVLKLIPEFQAPSAGMLTGPIKGLKLFGPEVFAPLMPSFAKSLAASMQSLPSLLIQSFTGGGGAKGAFQAFGTMLGADLFGPKGAFGIGIGTAISGLPKFLGGAITTALPAIGALIGPAISGLSALFGKLFGPSEAEKVRRMRVEFYNSAGGLSEIQKQAQRAGFDLTALLSTRKVTDFKSEVEKLQRALRFQDEAVATLNDTVERWGLSFEQLGPALQKQRLGEQAAALYKDFMILEGGGVLAADALRAGFAVVVETSEDGTKKVTDWGNKLADLVHKARITGQALPNELRPILQAGIDMGLILDDNGVKFDTLEDAGVTFAGTLQDAIGDLITEIRNLVAAIRRELYPAIQETPSFPANIMPPLRTGGGEAPYRPPVVENPEEGTIPDIGDVGEPVYSDGNYAARGGLVTSRGLAPMQFFSMGGLVQPRGTDTVPAMLTPGEAVIPKGQVASLLSGDSSAILRRLESIEAAILGQRQTTVQIDGRELVLANNRAWDRGIGLTDARDLLGVG